jgi:dihydroorotase/N-acyl-D-amino-acid deacylase
MSRRILAALGAAVLACAPAAAPAPEATLPPRYDVLITGGTVIDGSGAAGFAADVALRGDRIVRISRTPLPRDGAARVIDATGRVVAPGFIDLHAHLDPLMRLTGAESHVRQGVTTALGGPDGSSPFPLTPYLDSIAERRPGMNVAFMAGHNTIRTIVMGRANRAPTPDELARMRRLVAVAMGSGAFGLSTGLRYIPGNFASTDEVVALARAASDSGGFYTSHLREEGLGLLEGVGEAIEIGRRAGIPIVLTHHKAVGQAMWGKSVTTLAMVDSARRAGVDVMIDQYPYTASQTGISVLIPTWAMAGGDSAFARRMRDPVLHDSVRAGVLFNLINDRGGGDLRRVQFGSVRWMRELEGKTLHDLAIMRGLAPTLENGAELVLDVELRGGARCVFHVMDEEDVRRIMAHPQTMIASDGRLSSPGEGVPHPRAYGTFPRVLGHYVREARVLTLETAVHKMTGMPAARLGLADRGRLREGAFADVVIFDPATVSDRATFESPHQYPGGIDFVFVNGMTAVDGGRFTDVRGGRVLRHEPHRR